ncbi:hypothetical protein Tco_0730732 [Tanacetum coccineum]
MPHTIGRYQAKRIRKAQCPIADKLPHDAWPKPWLEADDRSQCDGYHSTRILAISTLINENIKLATLNLKPVRWKIPLRRNVLVFGWVRGKHACVDLIGVSPLVRLSSRGFTAGRAALKAALCKVKKHEKTCIKNQRMFISFAFDTFGFLAPEAVELLIRVQRVMHKSYDT